MENDQTRRTLAALSSKLFYVIGPVLLSTLVYIANDKLARIDELENRVNRNVTSEQFNGAVADLKDDIKQNTARLDTMIGILMSEKLERVPARIPDRQI